MRRQHRSRDSAADELQHYGNGYFWQPVAHDNPHTDGAVRASTIRAQPRGHLCGRRKRGHASVLDRGTRKRERHHMLRMATERHAFVFA